MIRNIFNKYSSYTVAKIWTKYFYSTFVICAFTHSKGIQISYFSNILNYIVLPSIVGYFNG